MKGQVDEGAIVLFALIVLIACVIIAMSVNLIPMLFKALSQVFR